MRGRVDLGVWFSAGLSPERSLHRPRGGGGPTYEVDSRHVPGRYTSNVPSRLGLGLGSEADSENPDREEQAPTNPQKVLEAPETP